MNSKIKHVLLHGVLKLGGVMFLFFLLGTYFFSFPTSGPIDTNWLLKNFLIWSVAGAIQGVTTLKNK